jgi:hypothetical protein
MREDKKVVFKQPVVIGGQTFEEVTMRAPKGKDLRAVSHIQDPVDRDFILIANLCNIQATPEDFDTVDAGEIVDLQMALRGFLS